MPVYSFRCDACGETRDVKRSMSECSLPGTCPECASPTRRIYDRVPDFSFRPDHYRTRPGDRAYDFYFQQRDPHTRQWVDTPATLRRKRVDDLKEREAR